MYSVKHDCMIADLKYVSGINNKEKKLRCTLCGTIYSSEMYPKPKNCPPLLVSYGLGSVEAEHPYIHRKMNRHQHKNTHTIVVLMVLEAQTASGPTWSKRVKSDGEKVMCVCVGWGWGSPPPIPLSISEIGLSLPKRCLIVSPS